MLLAVACNSQGNGKRRRTITRCVREDEPESVGSRVVCHNPRSQSANGWVVGEYIVAVKCRCARCPGSPSQPSPSPINEPRRLLPQGEVGVLGAIASGGIMALG